MLGGGGRGGGGFGGGGFGAAEEVAVLEDSVAAAAAAEEPAEVGNLPVSLKTEGRIRRHFNLKRFNKNLLGLSNRAAKV